MGRRWRVLSGGSENRQTEKQQSTKGGGLVLLFDSDFAGLSYDRTFLTWESCRPKKSRITWREQLPPVGAPVIA